MTTIADRRQILGELERLGKADLAKLWRVAGGADDFRSLMVEAFPELVLQYGSMAADLAAVWYDESAPDLPYRARVADPPDVARFAESASWALDTGSGMDALDLMGGTFQRGMWDMSRGTTIENVGAEAGALWARHASANACEFCRMLATRGAVYASESSASKVGGRGKDASTSFDAMGKRKRGGLAKGVRTRGTQKVGDKYHDHCHCVAIEVRPGGVYEPPSYVADWEAEYVGASKIANQEHRMSGGSHHIDLAGYGAGDTKSILREMRNARKG